MQEKSPSLGSQFGNESEAWLGLYETGWKGRYALFKESAARRTFARKKAILSLLDLKPGATVLDIGCDGATFAPEILDRGLRWIGIDASEDMIRLGMRRLKGLSLSGLAAVGDGRALPFGSDRMEGAIAVGLLNLFDRDARRRILLEMCRVLAPGGLMLCTNLFPDPLTWLRSRLPLQIPRPIRVIGPVYPVLYHSFLRELSEAGFEVHRAVRLNKYLGLPYCRVISARKPLSRPK